MKISAINLMNIILILLLFWIILSCKNHNSANSNTVNIDRKTNSTANNTNRVLAANNNLTSNFRRRNIDQLKKETLKLGAGKQIFLVDYDKFNDESFILVNSSDKKFTIPGLSYDLSIYFRGSELTNPPNKYDFSISSVADEWRFKNPTSVIFLIDGRRVDFGEGKKKN